MLIESSDKDVLVRFLDETQELTSEGQKKTYIEFGSNQAIIAPDEETKERVPEALRTGLVLTVYQIKGLEFNNVLLYDFFVSSKSGNDWRVITGYLNNLLDPNSKPDLPEDLHADLSQFLSARPRPLQFDAQKHRLLASELKQLYTAITRAKEKVWIFDSSIERRAPVFELLQVLQLVTRMRGDETGDELKQFIDIYSHFAQSSTPYEWRLKADEFLKKRDFNHAAQCYEKALDPQMKDFCHAEMKLEKLLRASSNSKLATLKYEDDLLNVATVFLNIQIPRAINEANLCFVRANRNDLVALIFEKFDRVIDFMLIHYFEL